MQAPRDRHPCAPAGHRGDPDAASQLVALFEAEVEGAPLLERETRLLALLRLVVERHAVDGRRLGFANGEQRGAPAAAVARARDYLAAHCAENVSLDQLAALTGLGPYALLRAFARSYGLPPHAWLVQERVRRAQDSLRGEEFAVGEAALAVGFADQSHLTRHFKRLVGMISGVYHRAVRKTAVTG